MIKSPILNPAYAGTSEAPYETREWFAVNSGGTNETKFRPVHLYLEHLILVGAGSNAGSSNRPEHGRGLNGSRNFNPAYAGTASSGVRTCGGVENIATSDNAIRQERVAGTEARSATIERRGSDTGPQDSITHPLAIPKWLGRGEL